MGLFAALALALLICAITASLPSSYAENSVTPEKIASLIGQIEKLQAELEGLHSQLEDMQNNKTKAECNCEELEERLDNLKSKLEEWEKAVNATSLECDCEPDRQPRHLQIGDLFWGMAAGAAVYVGGVGGSFYGHRGLTVYLSKRAQISKTSDEPAWLNNFSKSAISDKLGG